MEYKSTIRLFVLAALPISIGFFGTVQAVPGGDVSTESLQFIPRYDTDEISIIGNDLSDGSTAPIVTLSDIPLSVTTHNSNLIQVDADLAGPVDDGDPLRVDPNFRKAGSVELMPTPGAVGPEGPPGSGTASSVSTGAGLTGGPITTSGTIAIAMGGVDNTLLANPSVTVTAGSGLSAGAMVVGIQGNSVAAIAPTFGDSSWSGAIKSGSSNATWVDPPRKGCCNHGGLGSFG